MNDVSSSAPSGPRERPLSPHLAIYRPQMTSVLALFHRMTGVGLAPGLVVFVAWLVCLASGPAAYKVFYELAGTVVGQILLFGWSFALIYHLCSGIRHLLWNAGWFLDLPGIYTTGRITVGVAVLLTAGIWVKILGYGVCPWM